jgi:hypothetical protein
MIERHKRSIKCLSDTTEYILHAMSKNGLNTEQVSLLPEFKLLVHFLKIIIDGELNLPNKLTVQVKELCRNLDIDMNQNKKYN